MNICCEILEWQEGDVYFLEQLINKLEKYTNYNIYDVIDEAKSFDEYIKDINYFIYSVLFLNEQAIKDKCIEYFTNLKNEIQDLESNIYCNYIDSGYDSNFALWSWKEFNNSNKEQYIKKFLNNFNLEV